ncbi:RNA polymerase sigma factor [Actinomadura algeriensis]|uniref:RNA polymerase sigma factor (Sigma-70 family) n=1 Tax=Actinomadura algeriensis TaxID=1679523 RepID=A0ABR9JQ76_9ACTN|nr:sigma-70 family RNA polymerase sigma factor [Actinomadura algeriensis]MBE1532548.1 RNA polymerase sigma factor (sigma-70 family) [Actinomadura algeriensis]
MPRLSPSADPSDRKLVKGLNEGDESALAAIYDEYGERVYDYVLSMLGDAKAAARIVHDTFIDASRRAPRMRDHLHLGSWLYGAARRRCVRRGRVKDLYWERDGEFADPPFLERADGGDPGELPPSDELHELLRASLSRLDPVDQEIVLLAFRHGLPPARLGAALGLSARRAAARTRRGRDVMESALADELRRAARACASRPAPVEAVPEPEPEPEAEPAQAPVGIAVLAAAPPPEPPEPDVPEEPDVPSASEPPSEPPRRGPRSAPRWRTLHRRGEPAAERDPSVDAHAAGCPDCRRRGRVRATVLLGAAPAPVLPAALRHRVMHTATDPELAAHRADIAARGGALTPDGLPIQPDVPSPFTRRWLFTVGGMAGALAAAVVAVVAMGPGIGDGTLTWPPFGTEPQPSITSPSPSPGGGGRQSGTAAGPGEGGRGGAQPPPVNPHTRPDTSSPAQSPTTSPPSSPSPTSPSPTPPPPKGVLVVNPNKVELNGTKTAYLSLAAEDGPVQWTAMSSTSQLELSQMQGGMPEDGTVNLTVTLRTALIGLPGSGKLTFTDSEGFPHVVEVEWGLSLL